MAVKKPNVKESVAAVPCKKMGVLKMALITIASATVVGGLAYAAHKLWK